MATYNVVSVRRTPQLAGAVPVYSELGPLYTSSIKVKDHKHMTASEASFSVPMRALDADTKTSLRDLAAAPLEVWVYRDGVRIFAGPVLGGGIKGDKVDLKCRGRLIYLAYMVVYSNKAWSATDLFTMGTEIVDDWQALDYGNFGLLTAGIGTLGTTRDLDIAGATERPTVSESLKGISKGSFDVWVDADTGTLEFAAARGTDLSASVSVERGIAQTEAGFALGPGVLASEVYASGSSPDGPLVTSKTNGTLRASFGRAATTVNFDPVTDSDHLSDLAADDLAALGSVYFSPGGELFEVPEADYDNLEPGNTVEYSYDAGLGKQTQDVRVQKRELTVALDGTEKIKVEFE